MIDDSLFALPSDAYKVTSDDCYTPRWVFDAMGLEFDLDVAAPAGGPWHVPAKRWYTAEDDGLAQPWDGLVWCNPPYSGMEPWVDRFIAHQSGVLMGGMFPRCKWFKRAAEASDAVAIITCLFTRPDGRVIELRQQVAVLFRGVGIKPAERLAAADPYGAVLYGRTAA